MILVGGSGGHQRPQVDTPKPSCSTSSWRPNIAAEARGRDLMVAAEDLARERGCRTIALSVFGDNPTARGLYDSLGYVIVETFLGVELT